MTTFKDIKGCEGRYQINKEGEIKSLKRDIPISNIVLRVKECIMKHNYNSQGVRIIQLSLHGDRKRYFIADLLKEAFPDEKEI
jgi:hypothetical protein